MPRGETARVAAAMDAPVSDEEKQRLGKQRPRLCTCPFESKCGNGSRLAQCPHFGGRGA